MSELVEFLLARLAEDEAVAKGWPIDGEWGRYDETRMWVDPSGHPIYAPRARVLADVKAKRAVVAAVGAWTHEVCEDCWYTCAAATEGRDGGECCDDNRRGTGCDCGLEVRTGTILKPLASVYADHPDFDEAWRP